MASHQLKFTVNQNHNFDPVSLCCTKCGKHSVAVESAICLP